MTAREETVLAPIDPSISDENDWWEFSLTDVKVMKPGKMLYANLLDASDQNPVQVVGTLEQVSDDAQHLVLDHDHLSKRIVLDDVTHFAYGQTEDGTVEIWIAGKAGWYYIAPAKGYLPTFNRIVQAIDLLYFLVDRHQQGKRQLNPSFRELCEQYIFHTHGVCEDRTQSAEVFKEQAPFLLRCMIKGEEDIDWKKTHIFIHLRRHFRDDYERIMDELSPKSEEDGASDEPEASTPRQDPAAIAKSQANAIYQLIKDLRDDGHLAKRRLHIDLLTERLASRYSFSNKESAEKIIAARASAVLEILDAEDGFRWSRYVIYRELTTAASGPASLPPALLTPLLPIEESSDDEDGGRVRKSVLRPKTASVSKKLMGKRNRNAAANQEAEGSGDNDDGEGDQEAMDDIDTPSKTRGHELIRDPFSSAKPRGRSLLSDSEPASFLAQESLQTPTPAVPGVNRWPPDRHVISDESVVLSDTWTCRIPGCSKVINLDSSSTVDRKKLIEDHASEHDWETQMKVELVESERRMHTTFPVTNLMQYLISQHYQQMRTAFPEIYDAQQNGTHETESGPVKIENDDDQHALTPINQRSTNAEQELLDAADTEGHT